MSPPLWRRPPEPRNGVYGPGSATDFKVQAGLAAPPAVAHGGDRFPALHPVADLLVELLVVGIEAHVAAVVHDDEEAHAGQPVRVGDAPVVERLHGGAACGLDHDA